VSDKFANVICYWLIYSNESQFISANDVPDLTGEDNSLFSLMKLIFTASGKTDISMIFHTMAKAV
jgi:hypothetical protein